MVQATSTEIVIALLITLFVGWLLTIDLYTMGATSAAVWVVFMLIYVHYREATAPE